MMIKYITNERVLNMSNETYYLLKKVWIKYNYTEEEKRRFLYIILPIIKHEEFQKRIDNSLYPHHGLISLGEHILSVAAITFKLANNKLVDQELATIIAMFHDLYEIPWGTIKKEHFCDKHGFVHPIEATINAITWFPQYFNLEKKAEIIIDGIIHHMYPFPVRTLNGENIELNNKEKLGNIAINIKNIIILSTLRKRIGKISFCQSRFLEGRIVSEADKIVSFNKDLSISSAFDCIIGNNKKLLNNKYI